MGLFFGVGRPGTTYNPGALFINYCGSRGRHSPLPNARGIFRVHYHNVVAGYTHPVVRTHLPLMHPRPDLLSQHNDTELSRVLPRGLGSSSHIPFSVIHVLTLCAR